MAKRSGILLYAVDVARGMANVVRAIAVQGFQVFFRKETPLGQYHKERFRAVTFALDIIVAVGTLKRLGGNPQNAVVEHVDDVEAGEVAADVAGPTRLNEPYQGFAVLHRFQPELAFCHHRIWGYFVEASRSALE